jgi:hypothetical protein
MKLAAQHTNGRELGWPPDRLSDRSLMPSLPDRDLETLLGQIKPKNPIDLNNVGSRELHTGKLNHWMDFPDLTSSSGSRPARK